ncbi:mCG1037570, partial [Mus musculus]
DELFFNLKFAQTRPRARTHYKSRETAPTVKDRFIKGKTTGSILPLTWSLLASMTGYELLTKMRYSTMASLLDRGAENLQVTEAGRCRDR